MRTEHWSDSMGGDRSAEDALMTKWVGRGARRGSTVAGRMADLAKRPPVWAAAAGAMALCGPRARQAALRGGVGYVVAAAIHLPIKVMVGRRHPPGASRIARIGPVLSAFPSGHTASELAFTLGAAQELPLLFVPLYAATFASEWSLVRSRSHCPSDVMAGGALAVAVALAASKLWPSHRARARGAEAERLAAVTGQRPTARVVGVSAMASGSPGSSTPAT
jgi:undecaprenyl-diphosphatase